MTTRNFRAATHRSQGWWALEVTGDDLLPAYSQVRRLDQAEDMVRDLLALHFDIGKDEVGRIEVVPVLDADLAEEVTQTRQARDQAEKVRAEATLQTRRTAQHLKAQGLAQRDISTLLGLSHQAVSQLVAS
jgi:predicted XRE-type DNA-binding protein